MPAQTMRCGDVFHAGVDATGDALKLAPSKPSEFAGSTAKRQSNLINRRAQTIPSKGDAKSIAGNPIFDA